MGLRAWLIALSFVRAWGKHKGSPSSAPSYAPSGGPSYVPSPQPSYAPTATPLPTPRRVCTNVPSPWMDENGYTCERAPETYFVDKCTESRYWIKKHYCEQRCAELGTSYVDIECRAPSRSPTQAPSLAPTTPTPTTRPPTTRPPTTRAPTTRAPTRAPAEPKDAAAATSEDETSSSSSSSSSSSDGLDSASGGGVAVVVLLLLAGGFLAVCAIKGPSSAARRCAAGAGTEDAAGREPPQIEMAEAVLLEDAPSGTDWKAEAKEDAFEAARDEARAVLGVEEEEPPGEEPLAAVEAPSEVL